MGEERLVGAADGGETDKALDCEVSGAEVPVGRVVGIDVIVGALGGPAGVTSAEGVE
jgi:hypothetical protein